MRPALRKCISCGIFAHKRSLLRFVKDPEGKAAYDKLQKMPGRGAYLCPRESCLREGLQGKRPKVLHALKIKNIPVDLTSLERVMLISQQGLSCKEGDKNE